jgi:hypothetical protein
MRNRLQEEIQKFKKLTGLLVESNLFPIIDEFIQIGVRKTLPKFVLKNKEFDQDLIKTGRLIVDKETGKISKILIDDQTPMFVWKTLFRSPEMRLAFEELLIKKGFKINQITDPDFLILIKNYRGLERGVQAYLASKDNIIIETIWGKTYKTVREFFTEFLKGVGQSFSGPNFLKSLYDKVMPNVDLLKGEFDKNFESILTKYTLGKTDIGNEMSEINRILGQLTLRREEQHATLYKMWTDELKKTPEMKRLFDPKDPFYILKDATNNQTFRKLLQEFETSNGVTEKINQMTSKWKAFKLIFKNPDNVGKLKRFGNILERLFNVSLMWDTRKWKELIKNKKMLGWGRFIGNELGGKIWSSVTIVPAILSAYKFLGAMSESYLQAVGLDVDVPLTDKKILDDYNGKMTRATATVSILTTQYIESLGIRAGELSQMPAWSLDAYFLLQKYEGGWKPGDFDNQLKFIKTKSKENELQIDTAGQSNPQIADTLRLINSPKVDTIINEIDKQIKSGDVNPEDLIKK